MPPRWTALRYDEWRATRDTLHAHTQVFGKLAARLAPVDVLDDGDGPVKVERAD